MTIFGVCIFGTSADAAHISVSGRIREDITFGPNVN